MGFLGEIGRSRQVQRASSPIDEPTQREIQAVFIGLMIVLGLGSLDESVVAFSLWCGTRRTEDWHLRFNAIVVVSRHLHIRSTSYRDGVRFEEVSLGYPRQWTHSTTLNRYIREVLPGTSSGE
jgi:hypothetical protein